MDPAVLDTCKTRAFESKTSEERHRWFNAYDRLRCALKWKEEMKRSNKQ